MAFNETSENAALVRIIRANVDNERLTDSEFRDFVRNSVDEKPSGYLYKRPGMVSPRKTMHGRR